MKSLLFSTFLFLFFAVHAQEETASPKTYFGLSFNSNYQLGLGTVSFGSSLSYFRNKHQFELGYTFHPWYRRVQRKSGGEFHYRYFSKGFEERFNQFYVANVAITHNDRFETMSSGDYKRKELNLAVLAGIGVQIRLFKRGYFMWSLSIGASTYEVKATDAMYSYRMFQYYQFEVAPRISFGMRF